MNPLAAHPILTCEAAKELETALFAGDEAREWSAMTRAGGAIGAALENDFRELGGLPADARLLVLIGKGHNGGDALLAAKFLLERHPRARAELLFAFGVRALRPLVMRAYRELVHAAPGRVALPRSLAAIGGCEYAASLDGVFGFQFRAPVEPRLAALLAAANRAPVRLRAAIDLPSALGTAEALRADFTYATGSVKAPLLSEGNATQVGRVRYLDLGFFPGKTPGAPTPSSASDASPQMQPTRASALPDFVLTPEILAPLRALRASQSDKRSHGHLFIVGGSRSFPGAVLMSALAALHAGAGLVTAFAPESLAAAYAARVPEVMWVAWPETPDGGLALDGLHLWRARAERADALLLGPGLSREAETFALARELVANATVPLVLDADALQPDIVRAGRAPRILTPHAGEFARLAEGKTLREFSSWAAGGGVEAVTVLKGPHTAVCGEGQAIYHSFFGGPVLARGGSGDLLAGLIGGLLAGDPHNLLETACRGVAWHGLAADALARARGQVAVRTTELLEFLPAALFAHGGEFIASEPGDH
jgi:NAD(P)H-hydrate epimerase